MQGAAALAVGVAAQARAAVGVGDHRTTVARVGRSGVPTRLAGVPRSAARARPERDRRGSWWGRRSSRPWCSSGCCHAALTDGVTVGSVVVAVLFGVAAGRVRDGVLPHRAEGLGDPTRAVDRLAHAGGGRATNGRNAPPVAPEHRDNRAAGCRRQPATFFVRATLQSAFLLGSWVFGLLGALVLGLAGSTGHGPVFLYAPIWPVVAGGYGILGFRTLGRQEQLRAEASALPPVPPTPPKRGRPGGASGSKLALPGE